MLVSAVSKSKLHCCLTILIVFILIFLSLPLLLIYLANTRYVEIKIKAQTGNQSSDINSSTNGGNSILKAASNQISADKNSESDSLFSMRTVNCTDFALKHNLTLKDDDGEYC